MKTPLSEREQSLRHNFIETTDKFGEFHRLIYCTWCGLVVWDFNGRESSVENLQLKVGSPCMHRATASYGKEAPSHTISIKERES